MIWRQLIMSCHISFGPLLFANSTIFSFDTLCVKVPFTGSTLGIRLQVPVQLLTVYTKIRQILMPCLPFN